MHTRARLHGWLLLSTVFCTGACVLILEVLAARLLAPYFGSTMYAFSSVIGVTLGALSVGYALGGRLADARPNAAYFFGIILVSGAAVLLTKLLSVTALVRWHSAFSLATGPLVFSILLFTIPCVLLGMLSPFAIRLLQTEDPSRVGSLSGNVFFCSTLGSIGGSFLAGFFLIPTLGVQSILLMLAAALLCMGGFGVLVFRSGLRRPILFVFATLLASVLLAAGSLERHNPDILHQEEGLYQSMMIYDAEFHGRMARFMRQNFNASSAVYLDTGEPVFAYTRYYALAEALHPDLRKALVIGAGAYTIPQLLLGSSPQAVTDVVDIEPSLRDIAREYFGVADDPRIRTFTADGRRFLQGSGTQYDLIFSDAYQSLYSIPSHLATLEFFRAGSESLTERGVFLVNFSARIRDENPSLLWSAVRSFRAAFPHSAFFAVTSKDTEEVQNIVFLGCNRESCGNPCAEAMASAFLEEACRNRLTVDDGMLAAHPLLTDDYAPVEFLATLQMKDY